MNEVKIMELTNSGRQFYTVDDYMFSNRELVLSDHVDSTTMTEMIKRFMYLDRTDPGKEITLYITSPGGEVTSGLVFYDIIRMAKSPVKTVCIGLAASMGSIIFLAGDERCMTKHSQIMIHDPSVTLGNEPSRALAVQDTLENLMKTREELARIIADRTGKNLRTVYSKTKGDSYFNAKEALEFGLATRIIEEF